jgi:hypothetical protein
MVVDDGDGKVKPGDRGEAVAQPNRFHGTDAEVGAQPVGLNRIAVEVGDDRPQEQRLLFDHRKAGELAL